MKKLVLVLAMLYAVGTAYGQKADFQSEAEFKAFISSERNKLSPDVMTDSNTGKTITLQEGQNQLRSIYRENEQKLRQVNTGKQIDENGRLIYVQPDGTHVSFVNPDTGQTMTKEEYLKRDRALQRQVIDRMGTRTKPQVDYVITDSVTVEYKNISEVQEAHKKALRILKERRDARQREWNRKPFQK